MCWWIRVRSVLFGISYTALALGVMRFTNPSPEDYDDSKGRFDLALRGTLCRAFFYGNLALITLFTFLVHSACSNDKNLEKFTREPMVPVVLNWGIVYVLLNSTSCFYLGPVGHHVGLVLTHLFGFIRILPRYANRLSEDGGHRESMSALVRMIIVGLPFALAPQRITPIMLELFTPDDVVLYYPLLVSFMEYIVTVRTMPDRVCGSFSDRALSIITRLGVAIVESARLGLLVLVVNTTGTMRGLIDATIMSSCLEALARNNIFSIVFRACFWHPLKRCSNIDLLLFNRDRRLANIGSTSIVGSSNCKMGGATTKKYKTATKVRPTSVISAASAPGRDKSDIREGGKMAVTGDKDDALDLASPPPPLLHAVDSSMTGSSSSTVTRPGSVAAVSTRFPPLARMGRFKQIYLGVKMETQYWGVVVLVLTRLINYGHDAALDKHTGLLSSAMRSDWAVIAVVLLGEVMSDVLGEVIRWVVAHTLPQISITTPPVLLVDHSSSGNKGSVVISCVVWCAVGGLFIIGIGGVGSLTDSLLLVDEEESSGGGGAVG